MINYHYFEEIVSTQLYARENLADYVGPTCIYTGKQTAGMGTHGKSWHSPDGVNIYATFILPIEKKLKHVHNLAQIMSLSVAMVLRSYGISVAIKWPNDLLVNSAKIGGVLGEIVSDKALVGLGLNVNMGKEDCSLIDQAVTSMNVVSESEFDVNEVLCKIGDQFLVDFEVYEQEGFMHFYDLYSTLMGFIGSRIEFQKSGKSVYGFVEALAQDGRLIVQGPNGLENVSNGSIVK